MSGSSLRRGGRSGPPVLLVGAASAFFLIVAAGCNESGGLTAPTRTDVAAAATGPAAPSDLVTTSVGGSNLELWPFTGTDLPHDGQDATASDPINLIFLGDADPRSIREALLQLDGDRSGLGPPLAGFDCTWSDAEGDVQTTYTTDAGWTGNVVELECGSYGPEPRFHLRLFPAGNVTLGGAHFEVQIPGTTDHQVLSWELAEQLVRADILRAAAGGIVTLGAAPSETGALNPVPWRTIDKDVYNLLLSSPLGSVLPALTGGSSSPVTADVPLQTDGKATVLTLAEAPAPVPGTTTYDFTVDFQPLFPLPRPYCNALGDRFILAEGPIHLKGKIDILPDGRLVAQHSATGQITLRAFDPSTGATGEPYKAEIRDFKQVSFDGGTPELTYTNERQEVPPTGPVRGSYRSRLHIGAAGSTTYQVSEKCEP